MTRIDEPLRTTVTVCLTGGVLAAAVGMAVGHWLPGLALALGLLIGSLNGFLIRRTVDTELSFRLTSGLRLLGLTAAAIGLAAIIDMSLVLFTLAGVALAQVVLAVVSAVQLVRT